MRRSAQEMHLSAVNSINWARIAAQIPYYVAAALALGAPDREVAFSVPTGNFGNVFAAWAARRMGLPVARLIVGSNRNDIVARFLASNDMSIATVEPSLSPSMDIQVSSNFERLLFELLERDAGCHRRRDGGVPPHREDGGARRGVASLPHRVPWLPAGRCGHRARDRAAARGQRLSRRSAHRDRHRRGAVANPPGHGVSTVAMATAHPAKFPEAIERATGLRPALPPRLADLFDRPERFTVLPNDLAAVEAQVRALARRNA